MSNIDLFSDKFYKLPKSYYEGDFMEYLNENLTKYLDKLTNFTGELKELLEKQEGKIRNLCNKIVEAINLYLQGFPAKSYTKLEVAINDLKDYLLYPKPTGEKILLVSGNLQSYFRIRESYYKLQKEDIFHIPFQLRHITQSYRYSIPGLPCLYLSNSLILCWEELDRIINKHIYASRFEFDLNKVNLLNLSYTPQKVTFMNKGIKGRKRETNIFLKESIITWPLMFASTIYTRFRNSSFKIEYVIPQLLMQWCKVSADVDGIAYYSTRSNYVEVKGMPLFQENIAFPVKSNKERGLCSELTKKLKVTEPILVSNYKYLRNKPLTEDEIKLWIEKNSNSYMNYNIRRSISGEKQPCIFDRVEIELLKRKADFIFND